jgi:hypothetical protein
MWPFGLRRGARDEHGELSAAALIPRNTCWEMASSMRRGRRSQSLTTLIGTTGAMSNIACVCRKS